MSTKKYQPWEHPRAAGMTATDVVDLIRSKAENGQYEEASRAYHAWVMVPEHGGGVAENYRSSLGPELAGVPEVQAAFKYAQKLQKQSNKKKSSNFKQAEQVSKTPKGKPNAPPNTYTSRPRFSTEGAKKEDIERFNQLSENEKNKYRGLAGDHNIQSAVPFRILSPSDTEMGGKQNQSICFRNDRPASRLSGKNGSHCAAIDLVCGHGGYKAKKFQYDSPGVRMYVDPDFVNDSARIYISEQCDIDDYFNIVDGNIGNSQNRSGIGIKADGVRVVAREGIKLVTRTDRINSMGGDMDDFYGIDLLAVNNDEAGSLQAIPKGDNLVEALIKLTDQVDALNGIVDSLLQYQTYLNESLVNHFHYGPVPVEAPVGFAFKTTISPPVLACGVHTMVSHLSQTKRSEMIQKANFAKFKANYFYKIGSKYINSRYNNTT